MKPQQQLYLPWMTRPILVVQVRFMVVLGAFTRAFHMHFCIYFLCVYTCVFAFGLGKFLHLVVGVFTREFLRLVWVRFQVRFCDKTVPV
jgi:hypothetical protein